ncbi:MAG: ABC transporter permease [Candidatus Hodarchaeota archaeon]
MISDCGPTPTGLPQQSFDGSTDPNLFLFSSFPSHAEIVLAGINAPDPIHFAVESNAEVPEDNNHVRFIYALCPFNVPSILNGVDFDVSLQLDEAQCIGLEKGGFLVQVEVNDEVLGNWTLEEREDIEISDSLKMGNSNTICLIFGDISMSPVKLVVNWSPITWLEGSELRQITVNTTILSRTAITGWKYSVTSIRELSRYSELQYGLPPFSWNREGSRFHILGTDLLGHDILTGLMYGARVSLIIGFLAMTISTVIGVGLGAISGFYSGLIDDLIMRFTEIVASIPGFFLTLMVLSVFQDVIQGSGQMTAPIVIALLFGVTGWAGIARVTRAQFLSLRELEFTDAARVLGASDTRIIFKHLLPNTIGPIIILFTIGMAGVILGEAGYAFLGLGNPGTPSWGRMLQLSVEGMRYAWWAALLPGLCIFMAILAFNLLGDGITDAFNPKLKE